MRVLKVRGWFLVCDCGAWDRGGGLWRTALCVASSFSSDIGMRSVWIPHVVLKGHFSRLRVEGQADMHGERTGGSAEGPVSLLECCAVLERGVQRGSCTE